MMNEIVLHSDLPIPPGEYLEEVIEELGMTKDELARRMDRPAAKLSPIFKGRKAITADTALQLEKVVGVPAHVWTGLEAEYRLVLARQREAKERERLKEEVPLLKSFCYAELTRIGVVPKLTKGTEKVQALQKFLGVTSLRKAMDVQRYAAAFRCGTAKKERSPEAVASWLRLGELRARNIECAPFQKDRLESAIPEIRALTRMTPEEFRPRLRDILAESGVAFVTCPHLPRTYAHGATFWLGKQKAVLILSLRGKWADVFWFSLFHELGHIVLHDRHSVFVECDDGDPKNKSQEREADRFAEDTLIPPDEYRIFVGKGDFYPQSTRGFAEKLGIHPGIVVGRLQNDGHIQKSWQNDLRTRYEWGNL